MKKRWPRPTRSSPFSPANNTSLRWIPRAQSYMLTGGGTTSLITVDLNSDAVSYTHPDLAGGETAGGFSLASRRKGSDLIIVAVGGDYKAPAADCWNRSIVHPWEVASFENPAAWIPQRGGLFRTRPRVDCRRFQRSRHFHGRRQKLAPNSRRQSELERAFPAVRGGSKRANRQTPARCRRAKPRCFARPSKLSVRDSSPQRPSIPCQLPAAAWLTGTRFEGRSCKRHSVPWFS